MKISLIAAMDQNRLIGNQNQLPWHLPADLKHFKTLTLNKPILMGRKTYDSIGKPLPNRRNIVLSSQKDITLAGCEVVDSIEAALHMVCNAPELMVIGGRTIYEQTLPIATHLYLTLIKAKFKGDTYFPEWRPHEWTLVDSITQSNDQGPEFEFTTLERRPCVNQ